MAQRTICETFNGQRSRKCIFRARTTAGIHADRINQIVDTKKGTGAPRFAGENLI